jgi:hypothetical protein
MRRLLIILIVLGLAGQGIVYAQVPASPTAGVDNFSGIYEGARTITQPDAYPFTASGERAHSGYDPLVADPRQLDDCAAESMPSILWAGTLNTLEMSHGDREIVIRYEHGGAVRTIHMDTAPPAADHTHSELGFSRGTWEGVVLTVVTTHLLDGVLFTQRGYPVSSESRLTERYWRKEGKNIQMELLIDDPINYTEVVKLEREWLWAPMEQVLPWNCVSLGPRDAEPDIDALRRLLNQER